MQQHGFGHPGALAVALHVTERARRDGLPLDPERLLTKKRGQVSGLGPTVVRTVLSRHGITRPLSKEVGRTSRGSIGNMRTYVGFLNEVHNDTPIDLDAVEHFWVDRVRDYFASTPLKLRLDASRSLRAVVHDILVQAEAREKQLPGVRYRGAVLQHLVGATLDCALGSEHVQHHSYSTADAQSGRVGDFVVASTAVHVTTAPSEALIEQCRDNLNDGYRPVIVTIDDRANKQHGIALAEGLARNVDLDDRIDVFEAEQFVTLNLYERGRFSESNRRIAVSDFVKRYNEIIDQVETDPSLKIAITTQKKG
jgi:hypothetical protein